MTTDIRLLINDAARADKAARDAQALHRDAAAEAHARLEPLLQASIHASGAAHRASRAVIAAVHTLQRTDPEAPELQELRALTPAARVGLCCRFGLRSFCTCACSYECPLHGRVCEGSHD